MMPPKTAEKAFGLIILGKFSAMVAATDQGRLNNVKSPAKRQKQQPIVNMLINHSIPAAVRTAASAAR